MAEVFAVLNAGAHPAPARHVRVLMAVGNELRVDRNLTIRVVAGDVGLEQEWIVGKQRFRGSITQAAHVNRGGISLMVCRAASMQRCLLEFHLVGNARIVRAA